MANNNRPAWHGEDDVIILSFSGDLTKELLNSLLSITEHRLETMKGKKQDKKKFYYLLVEYLQNVYRHMELPAERLKYDSVMLFCSTGNNNYGIRTGNYIFNSSIDKLEERIKKINAMTADELQANYLDQLSGNDISDKGGAGLGLIDIARKSGEKIGFSIERMNDNYSWFTMETLFKASVAEENT